MSDEREFNLESPRAQKLSTRSKPKMGKVTPKKDGPKLHASKQRKRPRSTYVEREVEEVDIKSKLVAGLGSKLQLALFAFVLVVFGVFLAPHLIEFFTPTN